MLAPTTTILTGRQLGGWNDFLRAYHDAPDPRAFAQTEPDEFVRAAWFTNRYNEWLYFTELTKDLSFTGLHVLDVGAGTGFDTHRLIVAGAKVTALVS